MSAIYISNKKLTKYPFSHDPADEKYYNFGWKALVWQANMEYFLDEIVKPAVNNGFYYICVSPGISSGTEPVFPLSEGKSIAEVPGNVIWEAVPYNLNLSAGDVIATSEWFADTGVTLSDQGEQDGITYCKVSLTDGNNTTLTAFTLTNKVSVLRESTKTEIYERSILVTVKDL